MLIEKKSFPWWKILLLCVAGVAVVLVMSRPVMAAESSTDVPDAVEGEGFSYHKGLDVTEWEGVAPPDYQTGYYTLADNYWAFWLYDVADTSKIRQLYYLFPDGSLRYYVVSDSPFRYAFSSFFLDTVWKGNPELSIVQDCYSRTVDGHKVYYLSMTTTNDPVIHIVGSYQGYKMDHVSFCDDDADNVVRWYYGLWGETPDEEYEELMLYHFS